MIFLLAFGHAAFAEDAATAASPANDAAAVETESQQFARERLMNMANYLASQKAFSVSLHIAYDAVQESGQKIEFHETRAVSLQRPSRLRVDEVRSDGARNQLLFDGTGITIFDGEDGIYAQAPQPGDLDTSIVYFVRDLQMRLPLAPLLLTRFADELQRRMKSVEYVEKTDRLGEPAHHIAARGANADLQVWVSDSDRPLPLRVVLTYTQEVGQPQFRADFDHWELAPRFDKDQFAFKPPADAQRIAFVVQFGKAAVDDAQETGGQP
jgi:hypothetical protein